MTPGSSQLYNATMFILCRNSGRALAPFLLTVCICVVAFGCAGTRTSGGANGPDKDDRKNSETGVESSSRSPTATTGLEPPGSTLSYGGETVGWARRLLLEHGSGHQLRRCCRDKPRWGEAHGAFGRAPLLCVQRRGIGCGRRYGLRGGIGGWQGQPYPTRHPGAALRGRRKGKTTRGASFRRSGTDLREVARGRVRARRSRRDARRWRFLRLSPRRRGSRYGPGEPRVSPIARRPPSSAPPTPPPC